MLSKVLSKETCADCRFCCSFRRKSLWETPLFDKDTVDKYNRDGVKFDRFTESGVEYGKLNYDGKYLTDSEDEEAACAFLHSEKGCVLNDEEKPFDCKIWPLRIMKKDEQIVIALTPTCPAINSYPANIMEELVRDGLGQKIYNYAKEHPYIIKNYRENFPVLMKF